MDIHAPPPSPLFSLSKIKNHHTTTTTITITMELWWESITEARSHILSLSNIFSTSSLSSSSSSSFCLSSFANHDDPAKSLLTSSDAFTVISATLSSPLSGSSSDPLCRWLYDISLSSIPSLHLFSLSFLPLISSLYLSKPSLTGFEAFILSFYNTVAQNNNTESLEPQVAIKSTVRARIVGVALDFYYKNISQIPSWSKINFCQMAASWAGQCSDSDDNSEIESIVRELDKLGIKKGGGKFDSHKEARMPLPWELLQPVMKILGHCLMSPFCPQDVKGAASVAVRRLYVRANQDLSPQATLATRSLYQLDERAREEAARKAEAEQKALKAKAKSKAKMLETLLKGNETCMVYISVCVGLFGLKSFLLNARV